MDDLPRNVLPEQMAAQAEFIVNNLQQTEYQYTEDIDVDEGIYDCDCNSFVGFVLETTAPDHYAMVSIEPGRPRPRAFEYYVFFHSLTPESTGGWHRIDFLQDARRGDIIAWQVAEIETEHDTGHVFFVAESAEVDDSGVFAVRVYDSTDQPHFEDTRGYGEGQFPTGVGSGFINFLVDDDGRPTAFQFVPSGPFISLPIAIGRVEPLPPAS